MDECAKQNPNELGGVNNMPENIPEMITVVELQKRLDIKRETAYNLVRRKDFPSIKLGKEYRIFVEQVGDWLMKQKKNK